MQSENKPEFVLPTLNSVSVVVPILNERGNLPRLLENLQAQQFEEIILVDGGSDDNSIAWLKENWQKENSQKQTRQLIITDKGRAKQMNAGAEQASGDIILFLHADTLLPSNAKQACLTGCRQGRLWGRFDLQFAEQSTAMAIIAFFINLRSRLTSIATGDQAIFVVKALWSIVGGYQALPIMEDIALSKQLKKHSRAFCSRLKVTTSARRWQQSGIIKTVLLMWAMRLAFFCGVCPDTLARYYRNIR